MIPLWLQAGGWGLLAGAALLIGAAAAYTGRVPARAIAAVMAFGSGVLISAVAFELMDEAFRRGGFLSAAGGFMGGALVFTLCTLLLNRAGAHRRNTVTRRSAHLTDLSSGSPSCL